MSGVASYFFGQAQSAELIIFWGCVMSFFNLLVHGVLLYLYELYPTAIRAMGSGWAAGVGRIGGMAAPLVVGMMIEAGSDMHLLFSICLLVYLSLLL